MDMIQTVDLICHPDSPTSAVERISVLIGTQSTLDGYYFTFLVQGDPDRISLPPATHAGRADGLWRTTCFEAFVQQEGEAYSEFNFSPSGQWAAYGFDGYRAGMRPLPIEPPIALSPEITFWASPEESTLGAVCTPNMDGLGGKQIGLSAIIAEIDGTTSYWALRHPTGQPDFHHKDCFALQLPSPEQP
jgi:hypothetical protein